MTEPARTRPEQIERLLRLTDQFVELAKIAQRRGNNRAWMEYTVQAAQLIQLARQLQRIEDITQGIRERETRP